MCAATKIINWLEFNTGNVHFQYLDSVKAIRFVTNILITQNIYYFTQNIYNK